MTTVNLGVIIGNRDFFPDHLVTEAREDIKQLCGEHQLNLIMPETGETRLGGIETYEDAQKCAGLFRKNRDVIQGVLVILPNFGDEQGVKDTLRLSGLDVPILVQAYPDDLDRLGVADRRDGFCGKISVCNNLKQCSIPFTLTDRHVVHPMDKSFKKDLERFIGICRVVNGLRKTRIGAIGARPAAFNTVRYSEKILENNGIHVTTIDLSEIFGKIERIDDGDDRLTKKLNEIRSYAESDGVPEEKLKRMAKFGLAIDDFTGENGLDATAIQCWPSVQPNYGINICTCMSMMSEKMMPSACEMDIMGALSMYALQLAAESPSALVDWNNNYGDEDDKCVLFHCGNWAKSLVPDLKISTAPILGTSFGEENTYGAMEGHIPAGKISFNRISTDDTNGIMRAYIAEGNLTCDRVNTFGMHAVAHIHKLKRLMRRVCSDGFEHHVAINLSHVTGILSEAFEKYMGWNVYYHNRPEE